jgi:hypothetical protein
VDSCALLDDSSFRRARDETSYRGVGFPNFCTVNTQKSGKTSQFNAAVRAKWSSAEKKHSISSITYLF